MIYNRYVIYNTYIYMRTYIYIPTALPAPGWPGCGREDAEPGRPLLRLRLCATSAGRYLHGDEGGEISVEFLGLFLVVKVTIDRCHSSPISRWDNPFRGLPRGIW